MTASLIPTPVMQFLDADGNPLVGGKVYTYAAGTSTPLATYTDYGGATPNANPVILNSRGEASIWFGTAAYKLELYTAATVLIWTADNVSASTPVVYGTGVAAALAINVGTAGSILVNGGVLGTPSSGLVTNLTGTASININGTVGATTANTGAFTTLSASGTSTMAAINATTFTTSGRVSLGNASNSTASGPTLKIDGSGSGSDQIAIYEASADKWHINSSTGVLGLYNIATSSYAATISAANVFAIAGAATVGTTLSVAGASLVVGSATFNQSEWLGSSTTIQANSTTYGGFSLASSRPDANSVRIGAISWDFLTNTATYQNRAYIEVQTNGSTANKRGGNLIFGAAADNATAPTAVATIASTGLSVTGTLGVSTGAAVGGATPGAGGLAFPATAVAVADANTLDDYEEGTWTPIDSSGASISLSVASGRYTKIGNLVTCTFRVVYPSTGSVSNMTIGGLPFTANADANPGGGVLNYNSVGTAIAVLGLFVNTSATTWAIRTTANGAVTNITLSTADIRGTLTYLV